MAIRICQIVMMLSTLAVFGSVGYLMQGTQTNDAARYAAQASVNANFVSHASTVLFTVGR